MRKVPLITGNIYHIFNRGVNKTDIFFEQDDYRQFLNAATHYKNKNSKFSYQKRIPLGFHDPVSLQPEVEKVEVIAYCLMPNHFHLLVRQSIDNGLTSYMRHLANSYSHYINVKYKRSGPLFSGRFKSIHVESEEQLSHLSRYIHLNPVVSGVASGLNEYQWSSYETYVGDRKDLFVSPDTVLSSFKSKEDYEQFVQDQESYAKELEKIKHLTQDHDTGS